MEQKLPKHIALIMDGNRRWARRRGLPKLLGHKRGYERIEKVITHAKKRGITFLTFWAFSTENWNRDKEEIDYLMKLFSDLFKGTLVKKIHENKVRVVILGELDRFPLDIARNARELVGDTKDYTAMTVNIALNYGGRSEILRAVSQILADGKKSIDIELFSNYLYTKGQPDPDFIIRTGGEHRLSGFLPWQGVYAELYFPDVYWPDFDEKEFDKALEEYANRERRFGK